VVAESVREQPRDGGWHPLCHLPSDVDLRIDVNVPDRATGRLADHRGRLPKGQRSRPGEVVNPTVVPVLGQRRDGDGGDVLGIDERNPPVGHRQVPREDARQPERLTEVLGEPARPQNGPLGVGPTNRLLSSVKRMPDGTRRRRRQQHEPPRSSRDHLTDKPAGQRLTHRHHEVSGSDAVKHPGLRIGEVKSSSTGHGTHIVPGKPPSNPPPSLPGPANNEDRHAATQPRTAWTIHGSTSWIPLRSSTVDEVDVLTDVLHRARASNAVVRQLVQHPPWAMTYADPPPLSVVATLGGPASLRVEDMSPASLSAGDIAIITGPSEYTVADAPGTQSRFVVRGTKKYLANGEEAPDHQTSPRTYGTPAPGATTMLRAAYNLHGGAGDHLLTLLPQLAVIPAGPRTQPVLDLITVETTRDEPGQDAVLTRLLDLVLVLALRAWCAESGSWFQALSDRSIGAALDLMHEAPAHRWTVAALATRAGMSRAAFAARFAELVGQPPLTYLTEWRMTLAADLLKDTTQTIATVARSVGYTDPFAFSVAFKRSRGVTPSTWRA
jgi:AraC-like DNA-binding protein